VWEAANAQMEHAFRVARDVGCPAIIHCETGTPDVYADLARHCDQAGLARDKAVKHYSPPVVLETMNHGLFPSVLVGKDAAEEAIRQGTRFLMETDYMDDPRYPGAVLGPRTVPKRTKDLVSKGIMTDEQAWVVHKENPEKVYGLDLSA
jgi:TatD-related deoxyribonuclease